MAKRKRKKPPPDLLDDMDAEGWAICGEIWGTLYRLAHAKEAAKLGPRIVATIVALAERGTLRDTGGKGGKSPKRRKPWSPLYLQAIDFLRDNPDLRRDPFPRAEAVERYLADGGTLERAGGKREYTRGSAERIFYKAHDFLKKLSPQSDV